MKKQLHPAEQYAVDVRDGRIQVSRYVRMAVERYFRDRAEAVERGWYFDERAAARPIDFIRHLPHIKGEWAGRPIELEPWQQFFLWEPLRVPPRGDGHATLPGGLPRSGP